MLACNIACVDVKITAEKKVLIKLSVTREIKYYRIGHCLTLWLISFLKQQVTYFLPSAYKSQKKKNIKNL